MFTETTPKATPLSPETHKGTRLQLASLPDQKAAQDALNKMKKKYASVLKNTRLHLIRADLPKGTTYRIQTDPLPDAKAHALCAALVTQKAGCMVVKP